MKYKFDEKRHIHTLDGRPLIGTSSMASVLAKPLTWWASGLACEKFGWINKGNKTKGFTPKAKRLASAKKGKELVCGMDDKTYLDHLDSAYSAHLDILKSSAEEGKKLHAECEKFINNTILCQKSGMKDTTEYEERIKPLIEWAKKNVKRFIASEVHCFSKELWLGGIVDCIYEDMEGNYVILDFKSSKEVYLSQFWQCIGYALQLEENGAFTAEGDMVFLLDKPIKYVAVLPFGMKKPDVQFYYDMSGGREAIKAMITLYKKLHIA